MIVDKKKQKIFDLVAYFYLPYFLLLIAILTLILLYNYKKDTLIYSFKDYLNSKTQSALTSNEYDKISLDIKFKNYVELEKNLNTAISNGILTSSEKIYYPANLKNKNKVFKTKIRLKGAFNDHRDEGDKFSLRINIKGSNYLNGLNEFSIQHPKTRGFYWEKHFYELATKLDIFAPYYDYINFYVNGQNVGIMALEEVYGKETFVRLNKPEGIIIRIDDNKLNERKVSNYLQSDVILYYPNTDKLKNDDQNLKHFKNARGLLESYLNGILKPSEVFDVDSLGKFLAFSDLFKAYHGLDATNIFYYYNKYSNKLEPMLYDSAPLSGTGYGSEINEYVFVNKFFEDPIIFNSYKKHLKKISKLIQDQYFEDFKKKVTLERKIFFTEFLKLPSYDFDQLKGRLKRFDEIANLGIEDFKIYMKYSSLDVKIDEKIENFENLKLSVYEKNNTNFVEFYNINTDKTILKDLNLIYIDLLGKTQFVNLLELFEIDKILPSFNRDNIKTFSYKLPDNINLSSNFILTSYSISEKKHLGHKTDFTKFKTNRNDEIKVTIEDFLKIFQSFQLKKNEIIIPPKNYNILNNMTIPNGYNLKILPGAILKFAPNTGIISNNAIFINGTKENKVILKPIDDTWNGIFVKNSPNTSEIKNTIIEGTNSYSSSNQNPLDGSITFYNSDIIIEDSSFIRNFSDDFINIINSNYIIDQSFFKDVHSDAIDIDFSNGKVSNLQFVNIKGDAIDFNYSNSSLQNISTLRVADKSISIGEKSIINADNISVNDSFIGIAIKDGSTLTADNIYLKNISFSPIMTYVKKNIYSSPRATLNNVRISNNEPNSINQSGSVLFINGKQIGEQPFKTETIYE
jgi:hypothetical protein